MPYTKVVIAVLMLALVVLLLTLRAQYAATKNDSTESAADLLTTSWVAKHQLLAAYEQEQSKLRMAVIKQRKLYQEGEVSKEQLVETEQSFITMLARIQEVRRLLMETEIALAETEIKGESSGPTIMDAEDLAQAKRLPYTDRRNAPWSLKEAPNIDKYFFQTFGHNLPVSALGQTPTHDRLRFDHRNAMDVALHPDSMEGKVLIAYLRRSGVPFIAFRSAAVGASTGAHIHIGKPSRRMAAS
jgi:hypothetical protein